MTEKLSITAVQRRLLEGLDITTLLPQAQAYQIEVDGEAAVIAVSDTEVIADSHIVEYIKQILDQVNTPTETLNDRIDVLDLAVSVINSLKRSGILTLSDVLYLLQEENRNSIKAIRNFGDKSLQELITATINYGISPLSFDPSFHEFVFKIIGAEGMKNFNFTDEQIATVQAMASQPKDEKRSEAARRGHARKKAAVIKRQIQQARGESSDDTQPNLQSKIRKWLGNS